MKWAENTLEIVYCLAVQSYWLLGQRCLILQGNPESVGQNQMYYLCGLYAWFYFYPSGVQDLV